MCQEGQTGEEERTLADILTSFQAGDPLSDQDLHNLRYNLEKLAEIAFQLGPMFHIMGSYAARLEQSIRSMIEVRQRIAARQRKAPTL